MSEMIRIGKGTLTDTLANIDTAAVPTGKIRLVKAITLTNISAAVCAVTITFAGTNVIYQYNLNPVGEENTITIPFFDHIMIATERIQGVAQTTAVIDYYISGREINVS